MSRTSLCLAMLATATLVIVASACGSSDADSGSPSTPSTEPTETSAEASGPAGPVELAFADGSSLTIDAPAGATSEQFQDGVEVTAGNSFQLELYPGVGSTSAYKDDLDANDLNKVKRYLIDEPDELLWESEVGGTSEFHLYAIIGEGDGYTCFDTRGPVYTESDARAMLDACASAKAS